MKRTEPDSNPDAEGDAEADAEADPEAAPDPADPELDPEPRHGLRRPNVGSLDQVQRMLHPEMMVHSHAPQDGSLCT